jgi:hypothetical protein
VKSGNRGRAMTEHRRDANEGVKTNPDCGNPDCVFVGVRVPQEHFIVLR